MGVETVYVNTDYLEELRMHFGFPLRVNVDYLLPDGSKIVITEEKETIMTEWGEKGEMTVARVYGYTDDAYTRDIIWLQEEGLVHPL